MMRDDVVGEGLVVCAEEEVMGLSYSYAVVTWSYHADHV